MSRKPKGLALLGSTGSIGTQTLDIVRTFPDELRVIGLSCDRSLDLLHEQVREFGPRYICCNGTTAEKAPLVAHGCQECDLDAMVCDPDVDLVVTATIGDVSLAPTLAAIQAGKPIALANKETLVMAGELAGASPQQALNHPTWKMGQKITVDTATMINKAFEVIEAHWLFDVPWENIEVVVHPQSIIHSMVEFVDGSVKAQMSPPDMHLPIQYAIFYPDRLPNANIRRFDPIATGTLTFQPWDPERYPCMPMAIEIAKRGGTWPAALSGANDAAVELFLAGKIGFREIGDVIQKALEAHEDVAAPELDDIIAAGKSANTRVFALSEG